MVEWQLWNKVILFKILAEMSWFADMPVTYFAVRTLSEDKLQSLVGAVVSISIYFEV